MKKINNIFYPLLFILILFSFSQSVLALSPPWYLLRAQLHASLEADPCVKVDKLTGTGRNMEIVVNVCEANKASALATLISKQYAFGDKILVAVKVMSNHPVPAGSIPNTLDDALKLLNMALNGNQLFVKTGTNALAQRGFVEFKPAVVQYYSDDISDWYSNSNLTASEAFKRILSLEEWTRNQVFVVTTTSKIS